MRFEYSAHLREDVNSQVQAALHAKGIVNISVVAEEVRLRNLAENVALEDIEHLVMHAAQLYGAAIEFDGVAGLDMTNVNGCTDAKSSYHPSANGHLAIEDGPDIAAISPCRLRTH
ncbi:hypothetical protein LGH82_31670 [Mesorhizobium sp. PAMC28654]|uniref:hypothetical protein n=1 Tax=Mesorhizobium sp. PAMC28654 TaxID=2880934 RepID=UPI001D0A4BF0|nr:hypothetical protein [Mesorhizobium sp. PAMC28654]UDL89560.1 hypothetical protein LGH82_31670 [Mesorhizobium sp. PAMC28654]